MGVKRFSFLFVIMLVLGSLFSSLAFAEDNTNPAGTTGNPTQVASDLVASSTGGAATIGSTNPAQNLGTSLPDVPVPGDSNQNVTVPALPEIPAVNGGASNIPNGAIPTKDDVGNVIQDGFNNLLTVHLTASPAEPTTGPVTINVEVKVNNNPYDGSLVIKWLPGDKTVADFASAGNAVQGSSFQVTEKGKITVYVQAKACGCLELEKVAQIDIPAPPAPTPAAPTTTAPAPTPTVTPAATVTVTPTNSLPNTATPMYNFLVMGAILILAGLSAALFRKKLSS